MLSSYLTFKTRYSLPKKSFLFTTELITVPVFNFHGKPYRIGIVVLHELSSCSGKTKSFHGKLLSTSRLNMDLPLLTMCSTVLSFLTVVSLKY
jgi:hypothetical protein